MALIAAISEDGGLEAYSIHHRSINSEDFVAFIQILVSKFHGIEFAMFMDNLRVHKTKVVLEACRLHQVSTIYNVPYSPDFNGIESYFALVKA
jgi:transposase